jgi:integrase
MQPGTDWSSDTNRTPTMPRPTDKSQNLTDTLVKKLPVPAAPKKKELTRDGKLKRFFAQVTRDECRSFVIRYSVNRRERLFTIGQYPDWPTAAARERAKELLRLVDQGIDPKEQRDAARAAPTVGDLAKRFLEEHAPTRRPSYLVNNKILIDKWISPALGGYKVAEVEHRHIGELHQKITKAGSPIMANRAVSCLSKMFALAIRWGYRGDNPCKHAVDRNDEMRRQVYLKLAEIGRLTEALKEHPSQQAADCIRLMALTGCRRGEAMAARADQVDLEAKTWRKPAASTKQNEPHAPPLSEAALELLVRLVREAEKDGRQYLFPSRDGKGHIKDLKSSWESLRKKADITGVRLHDLRHTFASIAVSRGATLPLIGALLGHSSPVTTARYSHLYDDPQRALAESVAAVITGNSESAGIVSIKPGRTR